MFIILFRLVNISLFYLLISILWLSSTYVTNLEANRIHILPITDLQLGFIIPLGNK